MVTGEAKKKDKTPWGRAVSTKQAARAPTRGRTSGTLQQYVRVFYEEGAYQIQQVVNITPVVLWYEIRANIKSANIHGTTRLYVCIYVHSSCFRFIHNSSSSRYFLAHSLTTRTYVYIYLRYFNFFTQLTRSKISIPPPTPPTGPTLRSNRDPGWANFRGPPSASKRHNKELLLLPHPLTLVIPLGSIKSAT